MNWHSTWAWTFGFFSPLVMILIVSVGFSLIYFWWEIPAHFSFTNESIWSGVFLFVALAILAVLFVPKFLNF